MSERRDKFSELSKKKSWKKYVREDDTKLSPLVKSMFWSSGPLRIPAHPRRPCCLGRALCARVSPVSPSISLCCFFFFLHSVLLGFSPVSHFKKSYFRSIYKPKLGVCDLHRLLASNLKESSVFGTIKNKEYRIKAVL